MVEEGVLDFGLVRREGAWPGDGEEAALPFGMVSGNGGTPSHPSTHVQHFSVHEGIAGQHVGL